MSRFQNLIIFLLLLSVGFVIVRFVGHSTWKAFGNRRIKDLRGNSLTSGRKQINYSIVGATVPNFKNGVIYIDQNGVKVNGGGSAWGYLFNLVTTAVAWQRIGFSTIAVVTVDFRNIEPSALQLMHYVEKSLRRVGATVVYFDVPSPMKVRLSQMLRLIGGELDMVNDGDYVITGDSDLWPLDRRKYTMTAGKKIHTSNAGCCGEFVHNNRKYRMFALSNIGMTGQVWRTVFNKNIVGDHYGNKYTLENIKPLIRKLEWFVNSTDIFQSIRGRGYWYLDQHYASVAIEDYLIDFGRFTLSQFHIPKECKRLDTDVGWYNLKDIDTITCYSDAHIFKNYPWSETTWNELRNVTRKFFDTDTISFLESYRTVFENLYKNSSYKLVD